MLPFGPHKTLPCVRERVRGSEWEREGRGERRGMGGERERRRERGWVKGGRERY